MERSPKVVSLAIPEGSCRAPHIAAWWTALKNTSGFATLRSDAQASLTRIMKVIVKMTDRATMTAIPTWKLLALIGKVKRATVARHLSRLREWGLLGVVATGQRGEATEPGQKPVNDAAVYVLCTPKPPKIVANVDRNETPFLTSEEEVKTPPYARESGPLLNGQFYPGNHPVTGQTRQTAKLNRIDASKEMQRRVPALRTISPKYLAWVCKPFFEAGWTLTDVLLAIDTRPDGTKWPHDGATGIRNIAPWLQRRLSAWTAHGSPTTSHSQRQKEHQAQMAESRRQTLLEREQRRSNRKQMSAVATAGAARVRAVLRSLRQGSAQAA